MNFLILFEVLKLVGSVCLIFILFSFNLYFVLCVKISNLCVIFILERLLCGFGFVKFFFLVSCVVWFKVMFLFNLLKIKEREFERILLNFFSLFFVVIRFCKFLIMGRFVLIVVLYISL